jgi:hypothetical protein
MLHLLRLTKVQLVEHCGARVGEGRESVPYKRRGNIARIQPSSSNKMPGLAISSNCIPTGLRAEQLWQVALPRPQYSTDPVREQYFQKGEQLWKTLKIQARLASHPCSLGQHKITSTSSLSLSLASASTGKRYYFTNTQGDFRSRSTMLDLKKKKKRFLSLF